MAAIYINQSGYITGGTKRAVLVNPAKTFDILDENGTAVFSGKVKKSIPKIHGKEHLNTPRTV